MKKLVITAILLFIYVGLHAQHKLYITPQIGCYVGSYKPVKEINEKQPYFRNRNFGRKDFPFSVKLSYQSNVFEYSLGIGAGVYYSSSFYSKDYENRIIGRNSVGEGDGGKYIFFEVRSKLGKLNLNSLGWFKGLRKDFALTSNFLPFLGFEYRTLPKVFIDGFEDFNSANSVIGEIPYAVSFNTKSRKHFSLYAGYSWILYQRNKNRFALSLMYSFAFKDAGYFNFRFFPGTSRQFIYRTTTRGNGFTLKAEFPIKIFEKKKKTGS